MKKMKNKLLLFILFFTCIIQAQEIKTQIIENSVEIKTISPLDTDYSDLNVIGNAIGNARIVMLGEQGHGDAPTFMAKTRIIKYLHEKKGFDVIAFESDFFGLNHCNNTNLKNNIYSVWSNCEQNQKIFEYINLTPSLKVTGFDIRHHSEYSQKNYIKEFENMFQNANLDTNEKSYIKFKEILIDLIKKEYNSEYKNDTGAKDFFNNYLDIIVNILQDKTFENRLFWIQELKNLKVYAENSWEDILNNRIRDKQMGNNIIWLIKNKYQNKKIIIWAHSTHLANNYSNIKKKSFCSAGEIVKKEIKDNTYILGFTSYKGTAIRITTKKKYKVQNPKKNSLENWFNSKSYKYAFVNFNTINSSEKFNMKGLRHFNDKYNWINIFDGVFYIRDMYPCKITKPNNI